MKRLIILAALFLQSGGQQTVLDIQPTDWKITSRYASGQLITLPDGTKAVYAGYGSSFSRDLGITPAQLQTLSKGIYELDFEVVNYFPGYPGYYTIEISFGTQELCEASGWGMGAYLWNGVYGPFYKASIVCHSPNYIVFDKALPGGGPAQGTSNLVVKGTVNDGSFYGGWPLVFKNFSLIFTPTQ